MHILHTALYTFPICAGKENLYNNQEVLQLIIISFILMTLMFDSGVILKGEIRCLSLSGIKGLNNTRCFQSLKVILRKFKLLNLTLPLKSFWQ